MTGYWKKEQKFAGYTLRFSICDVLLDKDERLQILRDLDEGLLEYNVFEYFDAQPKIFNEYSHLVLIKENATNKTIGMLGAKSTQGSDFKFLYFRTAVLTTKYQGSMLLFKAYSWLLANAIENDGFYNVITAKTYNPVVYRIFQRNKELLGDQVGLYPHINARNDATMVGLAKSICHVLCPTLEFDEDSGCIRRGQAMAPTFYPRLPTCSDDVVYDYFKKHLTFEDQILCVVNIPTSLEQEFKRRVLRM